MTAVPPSPSEATAHRGPSRRSLARGAAWAVPTMLVTTAAPAIAASGACVSTFVTAQGGTVSGSIATMTSTVGGKTYTVKIASTLGATTSVDLSRASGSFTAPGVAIKNMKFIAQGIDGGLMNDGTQDKILNWTGGTTLVLNQIGLTTASSTKTTPDGIPSQTLTFSFTGPGGASINPTNLKIEVADISSVNKDGTGAVRTGTTQWRDRYYDAVGFSTPPTSISGNYPSTGAGTTTNLYRRSGPDQPTPLSGQIIDTFTFASATSGAFKMIYTQPPNGSTGATGNNTGWQFVGITRISFDVPC